MSLPRFIVESIQFELIENHGLETFAKLLSLSPNPVLIMNVNQILIILHAVITSSEFCCDPSSPGRIPNNVLSAHHIEEILLLLLCMEIDDPYFATAHSPNGTQIRVEDLILRTLELISFQCKASGISRELINTDCLLSKLHQIVEDFDLSTFIEPIVDCLLSLSDLNGGCVGGA